VTAEPSRHGEPAGDSRGSRVVAAALAELRRGRAVFLADGGHGGHLVAAARKVTRDTAALMSRRTTGMLCVGLSPERADELGVLAPAATASVDVKTGTTSGMSLADRVRTMRALGDPALGSQDFARPGHVFLLRTHAGGVLRRAGFAEGAVDLCRLAGVGPAAALAEVTGPGGGVATVGLGDIAGHRLAVEQLVRREAAARIPTEHGEFTAIGYRSLLDGAEHVALVLGDVYQSAQPIPTRVHVECLIGDVFGAGRCDCGRRLRQAMLAIGAAGRGVVVYLRAGEGPATGLRTRPRLKELWGNLVEDGLSGQILRDLGVRRIQPLTADSPGPTRIPRTPERAAR